MQELKCLFCGKAHTSPDAYVECVVQCRKTEMAKEEALKREKLRQEKSMRKKQVEDALNRAMKLTQEFERDYGCTLSYSPDSLYDFLFGQI